MPLANIIQSAFSPLIWVFLQVLLGIHSVIGGSWGWSIIGLTLIVRTLTFPLTRSQFKGMAKMRLHAPEMKKIQARYKDDRVRMNEEMMKYYKEVGFNPLYTCLPLVLQLPVFISLVYMLRTDLKHHICTAARTAHQVASTTKCYGKSESLVVAHHGGFLFVHDITSKATGIALIVLIGLYVGTTLFSSVMMSVGNDRNQRLMAIGLPLFFVVFAIQFAAGLLVYWIATNLATLPQQLFMLRKYGRPSDVPAAVERGGGGSNGRPPPAAAKAAVAKPSPDRGPAQQRRARKKRSGRRR
ncbi:MAG: YidC/Oxa1 family membrane protein insertase [Solirubrobacteraceae bacterium]